MLKFEAWTVLVGTRPVNYSEGLVGFRLADPPISVGQLSAGGLDVDQKMAGFTRATVDKGPGEDLD